LIRALLLIGFLVLAVGAPSHANESQFRGRGWYVRDPYIVDVVYEGPFATKAKCLAAAQAKSAAIPARSKAKWPDWKYYCDYLIGPV
jgi:hypothetical protein